MSTEGTIEIDGSMLEGGGQILRLSTSLAMYLNKSIIINNIRAGRPKPGLAAQHLASIKSAVNFYSQVKTSGFEIGSTEIRINFNTMFISELKETIDETDKESHEINIGTAGACTLVLQTILPLLVGMDSAHLKINGGTRVPFSPLIDYFEHVFLPMSKLKPLFNFRTIRHGFFPVGGGSIQLFKNQEIATYDQLFSVHTNKIGNDQTTKNLANEELELTDLSYDYRDFGEPGEVNLLVFGHGKLRSSTEQICNLIKSKLKNSCAINIPDKNIKIQAFNGKGSNLGAFLYVKSKKDPENLRKGHSQIITKNQNFRQFTDTLVGNFYERVYNSSCCVDDHMADQLIIFFALGKKNSKMRVNYPLSLHTKTAIEIAKKFVSDREFKVMPVSDEDEVCQICDIVCSGIEEAETQDANIAGIITY